MTVWYALMTIPQKELASQMVLERRGYRCFLPTEIKYRRSRREKKRRAVTYPMMRGYIFVAFDGDIPWMDLARLNIIRGVVGFDGRPAPIDDDAMRRLEKMSGASIPHRSSVNTHKALRPGDMAEIVSGQFYGTIVQVTGIKGEKARIMLSLFGGERELEISASALEAA